MSKRKKVFESPYKPAFGFIRHLSFLAKNQDMMYCSDWDKLTEKEQKLFYAILAGIQNDLGDFQELLDDRDSGIKVY